MMKDNIFNNNPTNANDLFILNVSKDVIHHNIIKIIIIKIVIGIKQH